MVSVIGFAIVMALLCYIAYVMRKPSGSRRPNYGAAVVLAIYILVRSLKQ